MSNPGHFAYQIFMINLKIQLECGGQKATFETRVIARGLFSSRVLHSSYSSNAKLVELQLLLMFQGVAQR